MCMGCMQAQTLNCAHSVLPPHQRPELQSLKPVTQHKSAPSLDHSVMSDHQVLPSSNTRIECACEAITVEA